MKSTTKHIILSTLLCILTLAVFLGFYSKLPQSVPVHFDSAGNPNSFWPRNALVFGGPAAFSVINRGFSAKGSGRKILFVLHYACACLCYHRYAYLHGDEMKIECGVVIFLIFISIVF